MNEKVSILLSIFITALVCANLLGNKIITIIGITVSVGIFAYPITFLVTDIIAEVYGKKETLKFYKAGIIAVLLALLLTTISRLVPAASFYSYAQDYNNVFGNSIRILIASLTAFLISQYNDIIVFHFLKKITKNKYLWIRNNLSTMISQLIDTTIFTFIAFFHMTPAFGISKMIAMIIPYWLLKVLFALFDTPFCYLGVKWLKKDNLKLKKND
jgi:uncharacterized integral membrane protein (TIGR00697 family)